MKYRHVMTPEEERTFIKFLKGELKMRDVLPVFGMNNVQSVANFTGSICREWVQDKKLIINYSPTSKEVHNSDQERRQK